MLDLGDNTTLALLFYMLVTVAFVVAFAIQHGAWTQALLVAMMGTTVTLLIVRRFGDERDTTD